MPIQAENRHRYPPEWPLISLWVRVSAGWCCEWCGARQAQPHPVTGSRVVLTVAHVHDPAPENVDPRNLAALCQRCHLGHDRQHHLRVQAAKRRARMATAELFCESVTSSDVSALPAVGLASSGTSVPE